MRISPDGHGIAIENLWNFQLGGGTRFASCGKRDRAFFFSQIALSLPTNQPRTCRQNLGSDAEICLHRLPNANPPGCGLSNHHPALLHEVRKSWG
jgi:hypothetical protein